jgi:hypothetical protein
MSGRKLLEASRMGDEKAIRSLLPGVSGTRSTFRFRDEM